MSNENKFWNEIARYLSGEMSNVEMDNFLTSLESDPDLKSQFEEMKKTWNEFESNPSIKYRDSEKAWNTLVNKMESDGLVTSGSSPVRTIFARPVLRIAATIILILGIGIPVVYTSLNRDHVESSSIVHNSPDGLSTVDLPDGSRVFLNKGSEISYPSEFVKDRNIQLQGEAFFDVMEDPENPFKVFSGKVIVSVLGTSFSVKQGKGSDQTEIFVESGKVHVANTASSKEITLNPGEFGVSKDGDLGYGTVRNLNYLSWKTKEFVFIDESVEEILDVLEEAYHVRIITEPSEIESLRLTSTYKAQSIDAILETICTAFSIGLEKEGTNYYLKTN